MNIDKSFEEYFSAKKNNINENGVDKVDWHQVRIQTAIAAMHGILSNEVRHEDALNSSDEKLTPWARVAIDAVDYADALVKELKGE